MSTDSRVTRDLIRTLKDGCDGFSKAADKLSETDRADLADRFRSFADQRQRFAAELETMAASYGDDIDPPGTVAGALHRGWMSVKDALAGSDPEGVLDAAEQGEDHAVSQYTDALGEDISQGLRERLTHQYEAIQAAHDEVRALRDALTH
jgi:uncharacterized protein (TIGR02284 family)